MTWGTTPDRNAPRARAGSIGAGAAIGLTVLLLVATRAEGGTLSPVVAPPPVAPRTQVCEVPVRARGASFLRIDLHLGSVRLRSWSKNAIRVEAVMRPSGATPAQAQRALAGMGLCVECRGRTTRVQSQFFGLTDWNKCWYYIRRGERPGVVDLTVTAPERVNTCMYVAYGAITLDGFVGVVHARTIDGPIKAIGARGHLTLENQTGPVVLDRTQAAVLVRSRAGSILATGVTGAIDARTDSGPIHLDLAKPGLADQWVWTRSGRVEIDIPPDQPIRVEDHGPLGRSTFLPRMEDLQIGRQFRRAQTARPLTYVDVYDKSGDVLVRGR